MLLGNAHDDVAATEVVKIIGERAERVQRVERIPALLEFQTLPLHGLAMQKVIDVDG